MALALAASVAVSCPAASAAAVDLQQVTTTAPTMHPGQTAWVSVAWTAPGKVSNVAVTVTAPAGFTVAYPSGRAYTSLYGSASLAQGTQDFTAFRLSVPYGATGSASVALHATWDPGNSGAKREPTTGRRSLDTTLEIPLTTYVGPDLTVATKEVTASAATPTWVRVDVRGEAPSTTGLRATASGPADLLVTYPGDGTSSGLNDGDTLLGGATDFTSFRLDASALEPGTYPLDVALSYATDAPRTGTERISLVVAP